MTRVGFSSNKKSISQFSTHSAAAAPLYEREICSDNSAVGPLFAVSVGFDLQINEPTFDESFELALNIDTNSIV